MYTHQIHTRVAQVPTALKHRVRMPLLDPVFKRSGGMCVALRPRGPGSSSVVAARSRSRRPARLKSFWSAPRAYERLVGFLTDKFLADIS